MRLLLFEPDAVAHDCFRYLLERLGHRVDLATAPKDFYRLLRDHRPDLVVLERRCPLSPREIEEFIGQNGLSAKVRWVERYGDAMAGESGSDGRCRIAVADSDEQLLFVLERRLINEGYVVTPYRDGQAALEGIRAEPPDLVLSEILLPRLDGFDLLLRLKETGRTRDIPLVLFSSRSDPASQAQARKLGAEDFIPKPVKLGTLVMKLDLLRNKIRQEVGDEEPVGLSGDLKQMAVPDLLQLLQSGGRTVSVNILRGTQEARIWFEEGDLVHAEVEGLEGEAALFRVLDWTEGTFAVKPEWSPPRRTIRQTLPALLIQGTRRKDETREAGRAG